jgi:hypothetical protein
MNSNASYLFFQALIVSAIAGIILGQLRPWHIPFYCRFDIEETRPGCPLG